MVTQRPIGKQMGVSMVTEVPPCHVVARRHRLRCNVLTLRVATPIGVALRRVHPPDGCGATERRVGTDICRPASLSDTALAVETRALKMWNPPSGGGTFSGRVDGERGIDLRATPLRLRLFSI